MLRLTSSIPACPPLSLPSSPGDLGSPALFLKQPRGWAPAQLSRPVTSSAGGVCAGGRAQLCISRAFSGGSLATGMNSPRSRRRPPHRVQRPFCSRREAKTTRSQINREQTTQTLPRRGGRGGTHLPAAGHLAPGATRGHSVLQRGARSCKINLGFDCPMLCCNSDVAKGNRNQCGLPPNSGAPLGRVNISIKAPGSGVSAVMERAPLFIL